MKTVTYFDKEFQVPDWVEYLAMDDDGQVWGYTGFPVRDGKSFCPADGQKCVYVGERVKPI